jgi:hypothetical protein
MTHPLHMQLRQQMVPCYHTASVLQSHLAGHPPTSIQKLLKKATRWRPFDRFLAKDSNFYTWSGVHEGVVM